MDKRKRIEQARVDDVCPQCNKDLGDKRVGTGRFADGVFCSLDCQARFHEDYYRDRIRYGIPSNN